MYKKSNFEQKYSGCCTKAFHILIAFIIMFFVFVLLNQAAFKNYVIHHYDGTVNYSEPHWSFSHGDEIIDPELSLPYFSPLKTGESYSISAPLSYDGSADNSPCAFFYVHHMYCRVYLDGEELFNYTPETVHKTDRAKSPGNVYSAIHLPHDCLGREFRVEFIPPLDADIDYELPNIIFGDYASIAYTTFNSNLLSNTITMLCFFLGIGAIITSTFLLKGSDYREGLFIGIFAILFSCYNLTECRFNFYLISNPYYTYLLNYTTFALAPVALMAFLREKLPGWRQKACNVMICIGIILVIHMFALHFSGTKDMREFLPVLHIEYIADFSLIFVMLASMKRNSRKLLLVIQLAPVLLGAVIDGVIYYEHLDLSDSDAAFITVGILIFIAIELHQVWRSSNRIYTESLLSREYHRMALIDSLTGIGNRRAFEADVDNIYTQTKKYSSLIIACLDVNNLKLVNDSYGHAAGDYIIRSAANILTDLANGLGSAFRIGGDEFCVLLYDVSDEKFQTLLDKARDDISELNSNSEVKLSLAIGYEIISDRNFDAAFQSADKKMYVNKSLKKELSRTQDCK